MFENGMLSTEIVVPNDDVDDDVDDRGVVAKERRCSWSLGDYLSSYITNTVLVYQPRIFLLELLRECFFFAVPWL